MPVVSVNLYRNLFIGKRDIQRIVIDRVLCFEFQANGYQMPYEELFQIAYSVLRIGTYPRALASPGTEPSSVIGCLAGVYSKFLAAPFAVSGFFLV
jgi:hypothetical protein